METKKRSYSPSLFAFSQGTIESGLQLYTAKPTYSSTSKVKNQLVGGCSTFEVSRCKCNLKFIWLQFEEGTDSKSSEFIV